MWYMVMSELLKLWKRKSFLMMLFVIVVANIAMLFYNNLQTDIPDGAYRKFDNHLQKMSENEKKEYIREYVEKIEGLMFIENINVFAAGKLENRSEIVESMKSQNPQLYDKYYNDWKNKNYSLYTKDLWGESDFIEKVGRKTAQTMHYDKYLEDIAAKENENLEISIFANSERNQTKENVFSKKVILQTAKKYSRMEGVKTDVYTYQWIDNFMSVGITEILIALLTFVLVYQMIYEEKKKRLFSVIRAMPRGRADCVASKIVALFVNTGLVTFLMYGVIFLYSAVTVGIYGAGAPIQSVAEFITCPYKFCVWQFMLVSILMKWMVLFGFGLILLFISILVSHYVITFTVGITFLGINVLEYYFVSGASKWNAFHYLNLWQFLKPEQVVGNYVLLNIFGNPVSVCMIMMVLLAVLMILFVAMCIVTFSISKNLINEKTVSFRKVRIFRIGFVQRIYRSVWGYESYKILVMNLGVLIIVLFGAGMAVSGINEKCYLTPNQMNYRQWMQNLKGKLTDEKEEQIQNQKNYYDGIFRQLEELEQIFLDEKISQREYDDRKMQLESELAFYPAFRCVYERYEYVKKDGDRQFVYEEGYNKLMGEKDHLYLGIFMIINLVLILFLTTTFTTDKEKGMHHIIRTTSKGRISVVRSKVVISFIGVTCIYLCFLMRNIYVAQRNYGMDSLFVSACNLKGFEAVPEGISILLLLLGVALLQIICLLALSALIMFVSNRIGNTVHAIVWEIIVLLVVVVIVNNIECYL